MKTNRKIAIAAGVLFITATAATSLSMMISEPILGAADYLRNISTNETRFIAAVFLVLVNAIAVAGIAIVMYPVLKKYNEAPALGYIGARIIESILFIGYAIILLTLLTFSQEYVQTGASETSRFHAGGTVLLSAADWTFLVGYGIIFTLSAMILNYILYASRLVPRWLSAWGILGAALSFLVTVLKFFDIRLTELWDLPIAVQEMVFAGWLIVKGFNASALTSSTSNA